MAWASRSAEERRRHLGEFLAVTPTMEEAMGVLRRCYRAWHEGPQASCSFVVGETGVGKTTAADEFLEEVRGEYLGTLKDDHNLLLADAAEYPHTMSVTFERPGHGLVRPVLKVFVDKKATFKQLFAATLTAIGVRIPRGASLAEMTSIARHQIREQGIRLIIFDECQHITESNLTRDPYEAADVFKVLMKEARVQVACVGLPHATDFLLENAQLETLKDEEFRMMPFALDLDERGEYRMFLKAYSDDLPFDEPSHLDESATALRLHMASEGYVAAITKYVSLAAKEAIDRGKEAVTVPLLAEVYRRKTGTPDGENPFLIPLPDPDGFRARRQGRRQEKLAEARKNRAPRKAKPGKSPLRHGA
ncbi:TniB family NTP-binding protein [Microvirga massiliensis]|uniref:TniB family NTP-binding protein n=1 Tax=Microvirga massiliensis TaxID=1033741 RepID=UPI00164D2CAA|nr:TniB family NTP-binding protein [Microvirga massiliensis]